MQALIDALSCALAAPDPGRARYKAGCSVLADRATLDDGQHVFSGPHVCERLMAYGNVRIVIAHALDALRGVIVFEACVFRDIVSAQNAAS